MKKRISCLLFISTLAVADNTFKIDVFEPFNQIQQTAMPQNMVQTEEQLKELEEKQKEKVRKVKEYEELLKDKKEAQMLFSVE